MKIACFAKFAVDPGNLVLDKTKDTVDFERSPKKISESDNNAVEEAVRIKAASKGFTVHIFTLGPSEAARPLKELVAMGADRAYLIMDQSYFLRDALTTATILCEAVRKFGPFDLILAGHASEDNYSGAVALMVAEMLGIPHIAYVSKLTISADDAHSIIAERSIDGKIQILKGRSPILVTVTREINTPRYVTTMQLLRVPRDSVVTLKLSDLGNLTPERLSQLEVQQRVVVTPVRTSRKNIVIDGSDVVLATKKLISFLKSEQVLQ